MKAVKCKAFRSAFPAGLVVVLFSLIFGAVRAQSPDLTNMGILLGYNKADILYLDNAVSNLSEGDSPTSNPARFKKSIIDDYRNSIQQDFFAQLWYLQGRYGRTFRSLRKSRNILQQTYRRILVNYIDDTWALLEEIAPIVVRARDKHSRHLLRLGYRDLESSRLFYQRGHNIKPTLHTNQINQYKDGLKRIRRARRYALLALIEAKLPHSEKPQFRQVSLDDVKNKKEGRYFKQGDFERVLNLLVNLMGRKLIPRRVKRKLLRETALSGKPRDVEIILLEIHQDNYNRLITERRAVWRKLVDDLSAKGVIPYKKLPERNSNNRNTVPR